MTIIYLPWWGIYSIILGLHSLSKILHIFRNYFFFLKLCLENLVSYNWLIVLKKLENTIEDVNLLFLCMFMKTWSRFIWHVSRVFNSGNNCLAWVSSFTCILASSFQTTFSSLFYIFFYFVWRVLAHTSPRMTRKGKSVTDIFAIAKDLFCELRFSSINTPKNFRLVFCVCA